MRIIRKKNIIDHEIKNREFAEERIFVKKSKLDAFYAFVESSNRFLVASKSNDSPPIKDLDNFGLATRNLIALKASSNKGYTFLLNNLIVRAALLHDYAFIEQPIETFTDCIKPIFQSYKEPKREFTFLIQDIHILSQFIQLDGVNSLTSKNNDDLAFPDDFKFYETMAKDVQKRERELGEKYPCR